MSNPARHESFDAPASRIRVAWRPVLQATIAACTSLPLLWHMGIVEGVASIAGIGGAAWLALVSRGAPASSAVTADLEDVVDTSRQSLKKLLTDVLPVWILHFGSVRTQTEEAVNALAQSLSAISRDFEAAGFEGVGHGGESANGETPGLLALCESKLTPVVSSMGSILDSKAALVTQVLELSVATRDMRGMADDVARIAQHTNILAINAAIAAAHAGDAGRGFAVIAQEVRRLSQTSADTAKRISERMEQVERMMSSTIEKADEATALERAVIEQSGATIEDVLGHVRQLGDNADTMREHGNRIRAETENLLVNLQFQDRVSQISAVLDGDFHKLQDVAQGDDGLPSSDEWLADLGKQYTMDDQRDPGPGANASHAAEEIVFF